MNNDLELLKAQIRVLELEVEALKMRSPLHYVPPHYTQRPYTQPYVNPLQPYCGGVVVPSAGGITGGNVRYSTTAAPHSTGTY